MKIFEKHILFLFPYLFFFLALGWAVPSRGLESISVPQKFPSCPAKHIRDILVDHKGTIWIAPENDEIYCLDPDQSYAGPWRSLKYSTGMPDTVNFTCLAEDRQGRIWVGTDNKGAAVFNGESWQIHDWRNTLPDNHVTAISISSKTGEIAIATSAGLAIYHPEKEQWITRTRANGLVENQIASLSFDADGNLWAAYLRGGISCGSMESGYQQWNTTQAPWVWSEKPYARPAPASFWHRPPLQFVQCCSGGNGWRHPGGHMLGTGLQKKEPFLGIPEGPGLSGKK